MRYRLGTLLLVVFFAGGVMGCWIRREPWVKDVNFRKENLPALMRGRKQLDSISSDNRILKYFPSSYAPEPSLNIELWDGRGNYITAFPYLQNRSEAGFVDDDTILIVSDGPEWFETMVMNFKIDIYRRRYPEFWWGYFYRFEFWVTLLSGYALIIIAARKRSQPRMILRKIRQAIGRM